MTSNFLSLGLSCISSPFLLDDTFLFANPMAWWHKTTNSDWVNVSLFNNCLKHSTSPFLLDDTFLHKTTNSDWVNVSLFNYCLNHSTLPFLLDDTFLHKTTNSDWVNVSLFNYCLKHSTSPFLLDDTFLFANLIACLHKKLTLTELMCPCLTTVLSIQHHPSF